MKKIKNAYELQVVKSTVTKHRKGENSTFNSTTSKEFFFMAKFVFNTGSVVEFMMVEPRVEYANIPTMELSYSDTDKARNLAYEEYKRVFDMINSDGFLYSRSKGSYCNLYGKDENSPTGVNLLGGCSSFELADNIATLLNKGTSLSPTENLMTAR